MKRKIRCIYIDGMERSGKTSVVREMRKFLKNKNKNLYEMKGVDDKSLELQNVFLEDNSNSMVLKENSILYNFYNDLNDGISVRSSEDRYSDLIRQEKNINHKYGSVYFFLIPDSIETLSDRFEEDELPHSMPILMKFYKDISQHSITQGLDIRLISFDKFDRIYDVRDKIIQKLEENYEF